MCEMRAKKCNLETFYILVSALSAPKTGPGFIAEQLWINICGSKSICCSVNAFHK